MERLNTNCWEKTKIKQTYGEINFQFWWKLIVCLFIYLFFILLYIKGSDISLLAEA